MNGHQSDSHTNKLNKPKVIQSPAHSNYEDEDENTSSSSSSSSLPESIKNKVTTNDFSSKPIREAKKRSLIYTGNTREFLETAIACGLIDDNGDEEEDNEYVPPGGKVNMRSRRPSTPSSSENESEAEEDDEQQSNKSSEDGDDEQQSNISSEDDDEEEEEEEEEKSSDEEEKEENDEMIINEEPSESGINWNVRNRPKRETHSIRFNEISKQDGRITVQLPNYFLFLSFQRTTFLR